MGHRQRQSLREELAMGLTLTLDMKKIQGMKQDLRPSPGEARVLTKMRKRATSEKQGTEAESKSVIGIGRAAVPEVTGGKGACK